MSLLDTASLIVTPNAYKEGKLYSVVPSDGSGDLSVTRATTATRVNSAGLVELVPYNLLSYSEQFDNAAWTKAGVGGGIVPVVTANAGIAPNGTLTADRVQFDCVSNLLSTFRSRINQSYTGIVGNAYSGSFYIKAFSPSEVGKQLRYVVENAGISNVITITADWQRIELSGTATATPFSYLLETRGTFTTNTTADVLLWGAQLVEGSQAKDYFATETRLNIPRLDYSLGSCPSLLVEPQRTNLATFSEQFDNAAWTKNNSSITANATISPDGLQDADKLVENTANYFHALVRFSFWQVGTSSFSIYAKSAERTKICITAPSTSTGMFFNLATGSVEGTIGSITGTITDVGNGWYRCTATYTSAVATTLLVAPYINYTGVYTTSTEYLGNGTSGIFIWGAQLEAGAYATSYIPTTSASVTRNQDVISKTGISSLINSVEGTIYVDYAKQIEGSLSLSDNTYSNTIQIDKTFVQVRRGGVFQYSLNYPSQSGAYKLALKWSATEAKLFVNGALIASTTLTSTFTANTLNTIKLSRGDAFIPLVASIAPIAVWPTPLTDDELTALTTI